MARLLEKFRRRVGDAGMVADAGLAWIERQHKQAIDMKIPVVSKATEAVLQPAVLGARVALANFTSGGKIRTEIPLSAIKTKEDK